MLKKHFLTAFILLFFLFSSLSVQAQNHKPIVELHTTLGVITLELEPENAPETVKNFLQYVKDGFYNGTIFHRVIADFMVQGGGFTPNMKEKKTRPPIKFEGGNGLKNQVGSLAMARTAEANSATSQFFINVVDNQMLDYRGPAASEVGYCVFGRVIKGLEVVSKIRDLPTTNRPPNQNVPLQTVVIERAVLLADKTANKKTAPTAKP